MNRLILITGDLASGKSTLADSLFYNLNIPCFKKDTIKEKYCDESGYSNREQNRELSVKAVSYMIEAFIRFAKQNEDIILEANFRHDEMLRIKDIAMQYNYDIYCFVLRGDIPTLYARFMERNKNRHPAHKSLGLDRGIEYFEKYINELREEETPFLSHVINATNKNEKEILQYALEVVGK